MGLLAKEPGHPHDCRRADARCLVDFAVGKIALLKQLGDVRTLFASYLAKPSQPPTFDWNVVFRANRTREVEGRQIFNNGVAAAPACALCHTLKDAGSTGQIGPNLDELKPDASRLARVIRSGMGPMPAFTALTEAQVAALSHYVSTVTQSKP